MPARKEKKAAVDITPVSIKPEFLDELVPGPADRFAGNPSRRRDDD
jgi:hypothetical protein